MKKVNVFIGLALVSLFTVSCSKQGDIHQAAEEAAQQSNGIESRIENSFVVGYVNTSGNGVITYSSNDIEDLASCVHLSSGSGTLSNLRIEKIGATYYLMGTVADVTERADFGYKLTNESGELSYEEGNSIHSCVTIAGGNSCKLVIQGDDSSYCEDPDEECEHSDNGPSYQCDWPWMV